MLEPAFKLGNKVRIQSTRPNDEDWKAGMNEYLGRTVTIFANFYINNKIFYAIEEDGVIYAWKEEWLKPYKSQMVSFLEEVPNG